MWHNELNKHNLCADVIVAKTERLLLRPLLMDDLEMLVKLINDWDIVRWMAVVPHPYSLENAKEFYNEMHIHDLNGQTQFYAILEQNSHDFLGGVGLHPPRTPEVPLGEAVIGYWIGKPYWGLGYMSEALRAVVSLAFQNTFINKLTATTDPNNFASQAVLKKVGFLNLGIFKREYSSLRGSETINRWQLTRDNYNSHMEPQ